MSADLAPQSCHRRPGSSKMNVIAVLMRTTVATIVAYLGAATGAALGSAISRHLTLLVNAALGALLAVTLLDIIPDAHVLVSSIYLLVLSIVLGYGLFWLIGRYVYPVCPACSLDQANRTKQMLSRMLVLLMIALGIHSTMDGVAVVVGDDIVHGVNVPVFLAVSLHKYPEGMALVLLLIGAGYSRMRAFLWALAIEATTELGGLAAVLALVLHHVSRLWLGLTFAFVGGGFLYLVINAFIFIQNPHASHAPAHDHEDGHHHEHERGADHEHRPAHSVFVRFAAGGVSFAATGALILASHVLVH